ncbi:MAG: hypothetical protein II047_03130 [Bacteroidales bacterium]|nr:hypothetical protein [Bacteroidales bacterium]
MTSKIPSNWRNCATCSHWCGNVSTDFFCKWVEFYTYETGRCAGGGFNGLQMPPLSSCNKWEQRFG